MTGHRSRRQAVALRKRLGELLLEAGVIDEDQLDSVLAHQRKWGGKLGQCIVGLNMATEDQVVQALSSALDCAVFDSGALEPGPELEAALALVPGDLALRHKLLPVALDQRTLTVAMSDPTNVVVVDELSFRAGRRVRVVIAGEREVVDAIRRLYFLKPVEQEPPPPPPPREDPMEGTGLEWRNVAPPAEELSPRRAAVLDALDRARRGEGSAAFEPTRIAAAVARLLVLKGVISDGDLLSELAGH